MQLPERLQTVAAGKQEVEDHQVVAARERAREPALAVLGQVDVEALGLERPGEKRGDPGLVLDDQYSHPPFRSPALTTLEPTQMTYR